MVKVLDSLTERQQIINAYKEEPFEGWKRIKVKDLQIPSYSTASSITYPKPLKPVMKELLSPASLQVDQEINKKLFLHNQAYYNTGFVLELADHQVIEEPLYVELITDDEHPILVDYNKIIAGKGARATVVLHYKDALAKKTSDEQPAHFHNGYTEVLAHEDSHIKIVKIYEYQDTSINVDTNISTSQSQSQVQWVTSDFTRGISVTNYISHLSQDSQHQYRSLYFGQNQSRLDHHYKMNHHGANSHSDINVQGALTDQALKVFRGTLDFKKGSSGSKGIEKEYVLLLTPEVKSHAIPALLCSEDDVEGEHAASAGQIEENKLYYLMSRGLTLHQAKKLLVEASFAPILEELPLPELKEHVNQLVLKGLDQHANP